MPHKESVAHNTVIRRSSEQVYELTRLHKQDYGDEVSPEYAAAIAQELLAAVTAEGIDLDTVVFSGYVGGEDVATVDAKKITDYDEFGDGDASADLAAAMAELRAEGNTMSDDKHEVLLRKVARAKAALKAAHETQLPHYFFADADGLVNIEDDTANPIFFAGTSGLASIGVYDKERLIAVDTGEMAPEQVRAPREAIESAKLMEFHPRYQEV